ncbi:RNA polymerase sigma-70 factor [Gaoshiqia sp. Z1-71]|uniref:RNA polymerase sigma-70 factor n=1 Tax=Gaoshiqia hydrogeniformans TaxID=3290090 RepID=UPI003BF8B364
MGNAADTKTKELVLFEKLKEGQSLAFDYFFERYYQGLCVYAIKIVGTESVSKDIVQDFFVRLWENRKNIEIGLSVKSYFIRSVHNRCLDHLAYRNIRTAYADQQLSILSDIDMTEFPLLDSELKQRIDDEIRRLPDGIRETFILSRFTGLSYRQIADQENISVKTVEYRISKALTSLRHGLSDYLYLLLL